jgi:hypothetical protein
MSTPGSRVTMSCKVNKTCATIIAFVTSSRLVQTPGIESHSLFTLKQPIPTEPFYIPHKKTYHPLALLTNLFIQHA